MESPTAPSDLALKDQSEGHVDFSIPAGHKGAELARPYF